MLGWMVWDILVIKVFRFFLLAPALFLRVDGGFSSWGRRGTDCGITIGLQEYQTCRLLAHKKSLEHMSPAWFIHLNLWSGIGPSSAPRRLSTAPPSSYTSHTPFPPPRHMPRDSRFLMGKDSCIRSVLLCTDTQREVLVWKLIRQVRTPTSLH